jgi:hypothetical protein
MSKSCAIQTRAPKTPRHFTILPLHNNNPQMNVKKITPWIGEEHNKKALQYHAYTYFQKLSLSYEQATDKKSLFWEFHHYPK